MRKVIDVRMPRTLAALIRWAEGCHVRALLVCATFTLVRDTRGVGSCMPLHDFDPRAPYTLVREYTGWHLGAMYVDSGWVWVDLETTRREEVIEYVCHDMHTWSDEDEEVLSRIAVWSEFDSRIGGDTHGT
jgi:hypothetical protein